MGREATLAQPPIPDIRRGRQWGRGRVSVNPDAPYRTGQATH